MPKSPEMPQSGDAAKGNAQEKTHEEAEARERYDNLGIDLLQNRDAVTMKEGELEEKREQVRKLETEEGEIQEEINKLKVHKEEIYESLEAVFAELSISAMNRLGEAFKSGASEDVIDRLVDGIVNSADEYYNGIAVRSDVEVWERNKREQWRKYDKNLFGAILKKWGNGSLQFYEYNSQDKSAISMENYKGSKDGLNQLTEGIFLRRCSGLGLRDDDFTYGCFVEELVRRGVRQNLDIGDKKGMTSEERWDKEGSATQEELAKAIEKHRLERRKDRFEYEKKQEEERKRRGW